MNQPSPNLIQISKSETEINFIDVFVVLDNYKWLILIMTLLAAVCAALLAQKRPDAQLYKTTLEIGRIYDFESKGVSTYTLEPTQSLLTKLNESYIPVTLSQHYNSPDHKGGTIDLKATVPENSAETDGMLVLESKGATDDNIIHKTLHSRVVEMVIANHQNIVDVEMAKIDRSIQKKEVELSELANPIAMASKVKQLEIDHLNAQLSYQSLSDERIYAVEIKSFDNKISSAENKYDLLVRKSKTFDLELEDLEGKKSRIEREVKEEAHELERLSKKLEPLYSAPASEQQLLTFMLMENNVERRQSLLQEHRAWINDEYPKEKRNLEEQAQKNKIDIDEQQKQVDLLRSEKIKYLTTREQDLKREEPNASLIKLKLDNTKEMHKQEVSRLSDEIQFLKQQRDSITASHSVVGTATVPYNRLSTPAIILIAIVAGLILSLLTVFCLNFRKQVVQHKRSYLTGES